MGWADDAQELDDSMLPSYARDDADGDKGKREEAKKGSSRREAKPKSFAALLGGGAETFEKNGDGNENSNGNEDSNGGGERGGEEGKTNGGKKDTSSGKNKSGGKKGKRADPSSNYKQSDLPEDCLLYTSPSPRDKRQSRMPSSA